MHALPFKILIKLNIYFLYHILNAFNTSDTQKLLQRALDLNGVGISISLIKANLNGGIW